jgi:hypothetical protein
MPHCPHWQHRERVYVTFRRHRVEAWVGIASRDGQHLILEFRTVLGFYVCTMPVTWRDNMYRDLIEDEEVVLERWVDRPNGASEARFVLPLHVAPAAASEPAA